jgi:hypothetical protein
MEAIFVTPKIVHPFADNLINLHSIQNNLIWRQFINDKSECFFLVCKYNFRIQYTGII